MEKISIMSMQRTYSMQRAAAKNDFENQKRTLQSEYALKLQKIFYERDKKLLAIDQAEENMLHQHRVIRKAEKEAEKDKE